MELNKTLSMLSAVATVSASAFFGTGCQTTNQGPVYSGYLDPSAKDFEVQKQAFENKGMVVEATFVADPANNGQMRAVWGVRQRTGWESTKAFCKDNADVIRTGHYLVQDSTAVMDTVNGFRQVSATKDVASRVSNVSKAVNKQTEQEKTLFTNIATILGNCNSN